MSKTIDALIEKCTTTSTEYFDGRGNVTSTFFDKHKFAELVIKECFAAAMIEAKGHMNPIDLMKCMKDRVGI